MLIIAVPDLRGYRDTVKESGFLGSRYSLRLIKAGRVLWEAKGQPRAETTHR